MQRLHVGTIRKEVCGSSLKALLCFIKKPTVEERNDDECGGKKHITCS